MEDNKQWTPQSMGRKGAKALKEKYGAEYFKTLSKLGRMALPNEHFVKMGKRSAEARRKRALERSKQP